MSTATVDAFLKEVSCNEGLAYQLRGISGSRDAAVAHVVTTAAGAGFEFTADQYESVIRGRFQALHAAKLLGPDEVAQLWGSRIRDDEISANGTCSWFECQGTGDHCGSKRTVNTDPQTGC